MFIEILKVIGIFLTFYFSLYLTYRIGFNFGITYTPKRKKSQHKKAVVKKRG